MPAQPDSPGTAVLDEKPAPPPASAPVRGLSHVDWRSQLAFRNMSAVYIFIVIFVYFSLTIPDSFLSAGVWRTLLDAQTVPAIAALAVLVPQVTGSFHLAVGAEIGFAGILTAALLAKTGLPPVVAIAVTLLTAGTIGLVTGLIITRARIVSIITTLGTSSVLAAATAWVSDQKQILDLGADLQELALTQVLGLTLPVYLLFVLAVVTWYVLERTPVGRRMYATGYNQNAARLAGVRTERLVVGAMVAGGLLAGIAGVLLTARINAGDPAAGPSLLLPALSAVFLGATQFRGGRFNVWGTILAVLVLAIGIKGLQLSGAPSWITHLFNGIALLFAVGLTKFGSSGRRSSVKSRIRRSRSSAK